MISLGGLVSQKAFGKFEMGKVISNPFATAFVNEAEGEDHEVSMANNSLDTIIKMATELKAKMGEDEKDIPAWIQDHITNAENFISQASSNYHEYGQNEARIAEDSPCWKGYKQVGMKDKNGRQVPNCVPTESVVNEAPNTGERIQNLNNRIKALRDKLSATKSPEQKKLFQDRLKNALQTLSNIKKDFGIKKEISNKTPKIFVKTAAVEKKIRELMADRKKAVVPYNTEKDPAKKEKLKQILIKLTQQIQGYEKNLIQLRDMEEEYLQQMHADAELDTTGL
jgi:flagellar biosynthesis chaperone FliJ